MADSTASDTELLTEHFGYPPVSLIDDIINVVNIIAERALNSTESGLLTQPPSRLGFKAAPKSSSRDQQQLDPDQRARNEVESGTHQLETLLCTSIDRNFDKFELYVLRNILCVRPPDLQNYIRLSHYDGLDFSTPTPTAIGANAAVDAVDSDKPSPESVDKLRRRLRASMRLNTLLHAEQDRNTRLLSDLQGLLGVASAADRGTTAEKAPFAFLHNRLDPLKDAGADTPLSTTTAFELSQLQVLRALSSTLSTLAPALASKDDTASDEGNPRGKSWRRERLEYVESATRRHLENVQGLDLGDHGEPRDGEWQGQGKNPTGAEIGGLEAVAVSLDLGDGTVKGDEVDDAMDES